MISAVYDCMVLLQAAANQNGTAGACLAVVEEHRVKLALSVVILEEVEDVLNRPRIRLSFQRLTDASIEEFLDQLREMAVIVTDVPHVYRIDSDPADEKYVDLA